MERVRMARTINQEDHAAKRSEILDAAQRLITSKGYERMTIQDMLSDLGMSNGAFFHYFDSKPAVLEAIVEAGQDVAEKPILALIQNPQLSALEKLQGFFDLIDQARLAQRAMISELLPIWYADDNAIVRQKIDDLIVHRRAPLLNQIVQQGIAEGVFSLPHPAQAGEIIIALGRAMSNSHAKLLLASLQTQDIQGCVEGIVEVYAAYMDAIERVLGAQQNSLLRVDAAIVRVWVAPQSDPSIE